MKIDRKEVEHVAHLARLKLSDSELETLTGELNNILDYMGKLDKLNTEGIEPMAHAQPMFNNFRSDEVKESLEAELSTANAPEHDQTFFTVPRII